ncbi:hypothetical protein [Enterobacter sp. PTB]|uniref:hypothetical protein n=1 Tax=Enterobacter TaxID=547 RepID=UPI003DA9BBAD
MFSRNLPVHAGLDPRAWPEYTQVCDELSKLTHPARPDVDWWIVAQLCAPCFAITAATCRPPPGSVALRFTW